MIKKLSIIFIILILSINSISIASTQNEIDESYKIKYVEFSKPRFDYSDEEINIIIDQTNSVIKTTNRPILPIYKDTYIYPSGKRIKGIYFEILSTINKQKIPNNLRHSAEIIPPVEINYNLKERTINEIENIQKKIFPDKWFDYEISTGVHNGENSIFLDFVIYPVRYLDENIYYISECKIEIEYSEEINNKSKSSIDNYDLIIIGPEEFSEYLTKYVEHKENHGLKTKLITLESIYDSTYFKVDGRDDAEKVKYFIKNAYDNWDISHVLLVGGRIPGIFETWYTPVRYVHVYWYEETKYISDLYFADLYDGDDNFSSWDTDNNNVFSEWPENGFLMDEVDLYPEVFVGRWPCRNILELKIIVDKTIKYENTNTNNVVTLVGGDNFEQSGIEGEIVCDKSLDYLPDFNYDKVYSSEMPINPETIMEGLGDGSLFLHMHGHGNPLKWGTHPPENFEEWEEGLYMTDVPWFNNDKYPITLLGGCHTAMFNVSNFNRIYTYTWRFIPEGLGWWLARKINGGGIATLGYTCYPTASPGEDGDLDGDGNNEPDCVESGYGFIQLQLLKGYGIENYETLGECWGYSVNQYLNSYKIPSTIWHLHTVQGFVLLGDPSLKIGGY